MILLGQRAEAVLKESNVNVGRSFIGCPQMLLSLSFNTSSRKEKGYKTAFLHLRMIVLVDDGHY